jgi:thiol:disulfide interchange protein
MGLSLLLFLFSLTAHAGPISAEIVAENLDPISENKYSLGIWIKIQSGWHTYWKNPGDSGLPPKMNWDDKESFKFSDFEWPMPVPFLFNNIKSQGYQDKVLLPFTVEVLKQATSPEISGTLKILVCKDVCIPEKLPLKFQLPPQKTFSAFGEWRKKIVHEDPKFDYDALKHEPESQNLFFMIIFAFLGGLILNLMPCVFPMISIKALEISAETKSMKAKSIAYTLGVLVTFWLFAALIFLLRDLGSQVGWGFQLQSKGFVAFLILLFHLMALNLVGVFEVGSSFMGIGGSLAHKNGWIGSFFTGVLSVVVASPCTAPFMGVALGYALSQPPIFAWAVFTGLGLGLAFPFTILGFVPGFSKHLPRPGAWMVTLKKILAFPLFATVAWLVWVLTQQAGHNSLLKILITLVLMSFAAYLYGDILQNNRSTKKATRLAGITLGAVVVLTVYLLLQSTQSQPNKKIWQPYSKTKIAEIVKSKQPVFIDFTAAWCITCQVNEQVALNRSAVMDKFREKGVILIQADWTNEDPEITEALTSFGRSGVPLYVLYDRSGKSFVFPQILTQQMVLKELDRL